MRVRVRDNECFLGPLSCQYIFSLQLYLGSSHFSFLAPSPIVCATTKVIRLISKIKLTLGMGRKVNNEQ